jgi:hypothetical protein
MDIFIKATKIVAQRMARIAQIVDPAIKIGSDMENEVTVIEFQDKSYMWVWHQESSIGLDGTVHIRVNSLDSLRESRERFSNSKNSDLISVSAIEKLGEKYNYDYWNYNININSDSIGNYVFEVCYEPPHEWDTYKK